MEIGVGLRVKGLGILGVLPLLARPPRRLGCHVGGNREHIYKQLAAQGCALGSRVCEGGKEGMGSGRQPKV